MDLQEKWSRALQVTKILRTKPGYLATFEKTEAPYIFMAQSEINLGDTVVRQGKILVDKPAIILPENIPLFEGFDLENELGINAENLRTFFLIRGISFPSLKYKHESSQIDIFEGTLEKAKLYYKDMLQRREDTQTGLVMGEADSWQFSLLIYVAGLVAKSIPSDIKRLWDELKNG